VTYQSVSWGKKHLLVLVGLATAISACAADSGTPGGEDTGSESDSLRVCAGASTLKGIDVWEGNGHVDWTKVKNSGRAFAFARVSDGLNHPDAEFSANWSGMKAAGLVRGAYQYFRPGQDPVAQADLLLSKIGTLGAGDLPPVIDVETDNGQSSSTVVSGVRKWIDRVKAKTGRDPIIYAAAGFWDTLSNTSQFAGNKLWVANYQASCPYMPSTWSKWSFWQSSESGNVSGVSGAVDLDTFNGSIADLQALTGSSSSSAVCQVDSDCNHGASGAGVICSNTGSTQGQCIDGCHSDADCPSGGTCDKTQTHWQCTSAVPPLGSACSSDADCNGGKQGTSRVCGASSHVCLVGCHHDSDCASGSTCDESKSPWQCTSTSTPPPSNGCPVLTYPSGIKIQTVPNAAMTASYTGHLKAGQTAPTCFLDVKNLHNPDTNETYDMSVHVAAHFQLSELVGTEVDQGWGNYVLVNPAAVQALEAFRESVGSPVSVISGFRGPKHQESVCNDLCGNPLGCAGTCSNNSRHMWGDAFDLPLDFYSSYYTNLACDDGFKFTYLESGTHLHVDQNPAYAQCVQQ
jgi:lysozyme